MSPRYVPRMASDRYMFARIQRSPLLEWRPGLCTCTGEGGGDIARY